jgi:hypothetical protein
VGKYEVFVDEVTLELVVPAVVQVLLPHQISDAYVAELGGLRQSRRRRCLARPGCPRHQYVRLSSTSYATVLRHGTLLSLLPLLLCLIRFGKVRSTARLRQSVLNVVSSPMDYCFVSLEKVIGPTLSNMFFVQKT